MLIGWPVLQQKLVFESSEAVSVVSTFDDLGLKEDLLRGIYAYSTCRDYSSGMHNNADNHTIVQGVASRDQLYTMLGDGVFNAEGTLCLGAFPIVNWCSNMTLTVRHPGDMWKFHRSMSRSFFSKDRISHFETFDR